jgi:hypothetical protein
MGVCAALHSSKRTAPTTFRFTAERCEVELLIVPTAAVIEELRRGSDSCLATSRHAGVLAV